MSESKPETSSSMPDAAAATAGSDSPAAVVGTGKAMASVATMMSDFDSFSTRMAAHTRSRREKDAQKVAALRDNVRAAEAAIAAEKAARDTAAAALQQWSKDSVQAAKEELQAAVSATAEHATAKLTELQGHIDALEKRYVLGHGTEADRQAPCLPVSVLSCPAQHHFLAHPAPHPALSPVYTPRLAKDKADVVAKVDAQCSALAAELEAFNAKFEAERADRQKREAALIAAQSELEQRLTEQIDQERAARERQVMQLRTELDAEIARRTKADERFQTAMAEELAAVRNVRVFSHMLLSAVWADSSVRAARAVCPGTTAPTASTNLSLHFLRLRITELTS